MRFSFRGLFSCLYRFPNFAHCLIDIDVSNRQAVNDALIRDVDLLRYTEPIEVGPFKVKTGPAGSV